MNFAPKISKSAFTAVNDIFTIEDGEPIQVNGIVFSNKDDNAPDVFTVMMKNGTTDIARLMTRGTKAFTTDIPFLADAGLSFELEQLDTEGSNTSITVFHSSAGGVGTSFQCASKISARTEFTSVGEVFTVENGEPIKIVGIILSHNFDGNINTNLLTVIMKNGDTTIGTFMLHAREYMFIETPFVADAGLSFTLDSIIGGVSTPSNLSITVFHINHGT